MTQSTQAVRIHERGAAPVIATPSADNHPPVDTNVPLEAR
jgi:hypothetical protein